MKLLTTILFVAAVTFGFGQTWADDVATIVYNKCAKCHHDGGIAPTSLMTYAEASPMASAMYDAISTDEMPPWPPDNNYQDYSHKRSLSAAEKSTMLAWLDNGYPEGNSANTPPPPVFSPGSILGNGDLTVQIPTYASNALGQDDYVCFSVPVGLAQNRTIRAVEIVPGNRAIVHHALIYIDETGTYPTDTIGGDCMGPDAKLIGGYTPGASPMVFPSGAGFKLGMEIPVGSNIVFGMHYPEGSYGEVDSTKVIFHFYPTNEVGIREVSADPILQNWGLSLPPNQVTNATASYGAPNGIPVDVSVLSVFPHMHLIGESIKAYAVDQQDDTIKYIDIHHWDFHWQDFYFFRHIQKTPAGSILHGEAVYNNTTSNEHNPFDPPQHVYAGESTTDEMMMVYFHYLLYQPGDENYDLESLMNVGLSEISNANNGEWSVYPVPFTEQLTINNEQLKEGDHVSVYIYDLQGKLVKQLAKQAVISGSFSGFVWDGTSDQGAAVAKGSYRVSMNRNGSFSSTMVMKQ
ncbi:MAG TPA: FlgD immunoglobulin-like domain containing protein [Fluviicola sp.]|nr:FlgD immunoglobulin-like domain containing protein [Fluviicola sp.]